AGPLRPAHRHVRARGRVRPVLRHGRAVHRAAPVQPREARLLRVRHRADAAARRGRRPHPGGLLPHRDALHPLRHRDGLPLPVRREHRCARVVRPRRDRAVRRHRRLRLRLRVAPRRAGLEL
ncbi:MAG: NADH ubiquinone oxidoreductase chain A, partial [uncultured Actinomycetospora sp.]